MLAKLIFFECSVLNNRGVILHSMGKTERAAECFDYARELRITFADLIEEKSNIRLPVQLLVISVNQAVVKARIGENEEVTEFLDFAVQNVSCLEDHFSPLILSQNPFKLMLGLRKGEGAERDYPIIFHRELDDVNNIFRILALGFEMLSIFAKYNDNAAYRRYLDQKEYFIRKDLEPIIDENQARRQNGNNMNGNHKDGRFSKENSADKKSNINHSKAEVYSKRPTSAISQVSGATGTTVKKRMNLDITQDDIIYKKYV